mmetsp:Transcript_28037/g.47509  ORF Transcript_28037/g.47509 Transcript_28037/m.47509 type:complete len:138 (-) Transcript_28037:617-1030(-)
MKKATKASAEKSNKFSKILLLSLNNAKHPAPDNIAKKFESVTSLKDIIAWHAVRQGKGKEIKIDGIVVKHPGALQLLLQLKEFSMVSKTLTYMGFTAHVSKPYKTPKYRSGEEPVIWYHDSFRPNSNYLDFSTRFNR